jgi:antirestriction protein ArdC
VKWPAIRKGCARALRKQGDCCADFELVPEVRDDHASYIASWLTVLKNDNRAIFQAAAHAQRAVDYLYKGPAGAQTGRRIGGLSYTAKDCSTRAEDPLSARL